MGFLKDLFRRQTPNDKDTAAIATLRRNGVDLQNPVAVRHFLYFALEYEARMVAAELTNQGFDVELHDAPMNSGLLVLARRNDTLDEASARRLRLQLYELATSQKGEYDGWEVDLPSGDPVAARH